MTAPPHRHPGSDGGPDDAIDAFDAALAHETEDDDTFDFFDLDDYADGDFDLFDHEDELTEQEEAVLEVLHVKLEEGRTTVAAIADAVLAAGIYTFDDDAADPDSSDDADADDDADDGPVDRDDLEELIRDLAAFEEGFWYQDDAMAHYEHLLDGTVFTHRLTAVDLAHHRLPTYGDLLLADTGLAPDQATTDDPTRIRLGTGPDAGYLVVPPDQLAGRGEGDLVGLRSRAGRLELEPVTGTSPATAEVAAILRTLQPVLDEGQGDDLMPHLLNALLHQPGLFAQPTLPLSELLDAAGLSRDGDAYGPRDRIWRLTGYDNLVRRASVSYELGPCCVDALHVVDTRWRAERRGLTDHPDAPTVAAVLEALDHGDVAPAFAEAVDSSYIGDQLRDFADALLAGAAPTAVGARLLVAQLAEQRGDIERLESLHRRVLELDPACPAAIESLARLAYDRSDFPAASRLFRRIHEPDHPYVTATEMMIPLLITAGRNDRCPCGSGRKYKVCHADRVLVEPTRQPFILLGKLASFAVAPARRQVLAAASWRSELDPDVILSSRFLFESFLLSPLNADDYRNLRGALLPDDERALLDRVVAAPIRLTEVAGFEATTGTLTLVDALTGETLPTTIPADADVTDSERGDLALARVVDGQLVGELTLVPPDVAPSVRDLLAPGPPSLDDLYRWFAESM